MINRRELGQLAGMTVAETSSWDGYRLSPLTVWTSVGWMSTTVTRRSSFCSSSSCPTIGARA